MSFHDLVITISAENRAAAEFTKVASNAADMASEVAAHPITIRAEDLATGEVNRVAEEFARVRSEIEASPFAVDVSQIHEASDAFIEAAANATEMGVQVQASGSVLTASFESCSVEAASMGAEVLEATESVTLGFQYAGEEAENLAAKVSLSGANIKEAARDFTTLGMGTAAVARLSEQFGILNKEQAGWVRTMGMALTAVGGVVRAVQVLSSVTGVATAVQNALNISYGTFLALTGVGIAVIIGAAAAMWYFASQMNATTESVKGYNAAASEMPTHSRGIQRAGEEELYRRGVEW